MCVLAGLLLYLFLFNNKIIVIKNIVACLLLIQFMIITKKERYEAVLF